MRPLGTPLGTPLYLASLLASLLAVAPPAAAQYTTITKRADGTLPDEDVGDHQLTGDGEHLVFATKASTFVDDDTNGLYDVYVKVRSTGAVERISVGVGGSETDGDSRWPAISEDGRFVAFASTATNVVSGDANGAPDVFLVDRELDTTTLVTVTWLGTQQATGTFAPRMLDVSDDGRYVTFVSSSDDLVTLSTIGATRDVYLRDVVGETTTLVSIPPFEDSSDGGWFPSIDAAGSQVAFTSNGRFLHPADSDGNDDVFLWTRASGSIDLVSITPDGTSGSSPGHSERPRITPDGRTVVFESTTTDLDPLDPHPDRDVYLRDLTLGTTEVVSLAQDGTAGPYSDCFEPHVSADGRYVVFHTNGELTGVPNTSFPYQQVVLRDRTLGTTEYISIPRWWFSGFDTGGSHAFVTDDGSEVVFRDNAPPQEDPSDINRSVVARARDGATNLMSLQMYNGYGVGDSPVMRVYDAQPTTLTFTLFSSGMDGFSVLGHDLDLSWPVDLVATGFSDADGAVTLIGPLVPASASGLTFYIEAVSFSGGELSDSNPVELPIF